MPAGNAEIWRNWLAALSAGPEDVRASLAELWDADADYYPVRKFTEAQPCHGVDEFAHFIAQYMRRGRTRSGRSGS